MSLLLLLLLFGSALAAGLSFLFFRKTNPRLLKLSLAFSGAFLFAITVLHLMPEAFESGAEEAGLWILAGFLLQLVLEFFSEGIEHGHIHLHKKTESAFPLTIMTGLCLHSFFEGIPLARADQNLPLFGGIVLHHLPVAFALMSLLVASGLKDSTSILNLLLFSMMAPLGAIAGTYITGDMHHGPEFLRNTMALVIGIFLHISTTILFETGEEHRFNYLKMAAILAGFALAWASF